MVDEEISVDWWRRRREEEWMGWPVMVRKSLRERETVRDRE